MRAKLSYWWERLTVSIWFVPLTMAIGALVLAVVMLEIDTRFGTPAWSEFLRIDAEGVRQVVAVISGAMMTITGVVFSVSVVTLALASNQFGPKLLRNYLRNTGNKFTLGLFVSTFIYGLLILASVDTNQGGFVPIWSMLVSLILTVVATGGLIYYIHSISMAAQADHVIALVGNELNSTIETMLVSVEEDKQAASPLSSQEWSIQKKGAFPLPIRAPRSGYIQNIDYPGIAAWCCSHKVFLALDKRAGHFIIEHTSIGICYTREDLSDTAIETLLGLIVLGQQRTPVQDIEFPIVQLVQIALRALSPGINDSLTGITCIDWLSAALGHMARCTFPSPYYRDTEGTLRVAAHGFSFHSAVGAVFDPLRQNARENAMVTIRLLEMLEQIISVACRNDYQEALMIQAELIHKGAENGIWEPTDRNIVNERFERCRRAQEHMRRAVGEQLNEVQ